MSHVQAKTDPPHKETQGPESKQLDQLRFEEAITHLHQRIAVVPYRSTNRANIHSLPTELLTEVFLYVVRQARSNLRIWRSILFVCRAWYRIALGASQLWTSIYCADSGFVRAALKHSRTTILTVYSWATSKKDRFNFDHADFEACQTLILPHLYRLRSVIFVAYSDHPIISAEDLHAPNLEHLKLDVWDRFEEVPEAFYHVTRLRLPKLTSLDLEGRYIFAEFKEWFPRNLTSLRFSECIFSTINEFLDAIRGLHALKVLRLNEVQFQTPFAESSPPIVHLPRLQLLEVIHDCPTVYRHVNSRNYSDILRFFSIPPTVKFYHCDWYVMDDSDTCLPAFRFIEDNMLLPLKGIRQNGCEPDYPRTLRVYIDSGTMWLVAWTTEVPLDSLRFNAGRECNYDQYAKLHVRLGPHDDLLHRVPGRRYLKKFISQYDLQHVTTLALCLQLVDGVMWFTKEIPANLWFDLMREMPNLQYFFTDSPHVMEHFQLSDDMTAREGDPTTVSRLYPSLRVICYELWKSLSLKDATVPTFVQFASQLRDEKSRKLERLEIRLIPKGRIQKKCVKMLVDADIADMVKIDREVADFWYEGWFGIDSDDDEVDNSKKYEDGSDADYEEYEDGSDATQTTKKQVLVLGRRGDAAAQQ